MVEIIEMGVWAIIGMAIISVIAMLGLHFLAQRSQQHMAEIGQTNLANIHSMGIQAIIGANEMVIIDESLESRNKRNSAVLVKKEVPGTYTLETK